MNQAAARPRRSGVGLARDRPCWASLAYVIFYSGEIPADRVYIRGRGLKDCLNPDH